MKMDDLDLQIKYTPAERQFLLYEYFQKHTNKEHPVSQKRYWTILKHLKSTSHRTHYTATLMCCEAQ